MDILQLNHLVTENIYCVNPLYLLINHTSGCIEEKNGNKYLIFDSTDENKELLKSIQMLGMELKTNQNSKWW